MIEIKVYANLRKEFGLTSGFKCEYDNNNKTVTIKEILDYYKVNVDKIAIILVNGKPSSLQTLVKDGDVVAFFSPVAGG